MPAHDFSFALELSGRPPTADMYLDLASQVLQHVDGSGQNAPSILKALEEAMAQAAARTGFNARLEFSGVDGQLTIAVSAGNERIWQTNVPVS